MTPRRTSPGSRATEDVSAGYVGRPDAAPAVRGLGIQGHLHEHVDRPTRRDGTSRQCLCEGESVDGLHDIGPRRDGPRLVPLDLADHVPPHRRREALEVGGFLPGLLVLVLGDLHAPELMEESDIGRWEGLRHDDEPDAARGPTSLRAGPVNAFANLGEPRCDLGRTGCIGG